MEKSKMRLAALLIIAIVFSMSAAFLPILYGEKMEKSENYPLTAEVVELDRENDIVVCKDYNGNLWEFFGCEDWQVDDVASLLMNDNGTENIYDDEILTARYNGTFEGWN